MVVPEGNTEDIGSLVYEMFDLRDIRLFPSRGGTTRSIRSTAKVHTGEVDTSKEG